MIKHFAYEYVSFGELYQAYLDCMKNKHDSVNAIKFNFDLSTNLLKLWYDLNSGTYKIGKSIVFCVEYPVKREVFAADFRDRIVHHLIMNRLMAHFENEFIEDSYSCRKKKGTLYAVQRCEQFMKEASENYTKDCYIIKCDLKSFFMTIRKQKLYDKLCAFVDKNYHPDDERDVAYIKWLLKLIVFNEPQKNCIRKQNISHWEGLPKEKSLFSCDPDKGIPIGNLTSQVFANFYLSEFDHFVMEELGYKYYGRYVDDFFIIVDGNESPKKVLDACREKLDSMGVTLHPNKTYVQHVKKGVKFVGSVIKDHGTYISNRTKGNFWMALKNHSEALDKILEAGDEPTEDEVRYFVTCVNSYLGFMVHSKTFNIRKKSLFSPFMKKWYNFCYVDKDLTKLTPFREYVEGGKNSKRYSRKEYLRSNDYQVLKEKFSDVPMLSGL